MQKPMRVVITGATSGIGLHAAQQLLSQGHRLTVLCRDPKRAVERLGSPTPQLRLLPTDLANLSQVDQACQQLRRDNEAIDAIVLNAGLQYAGAQQARFSAQGIELTFAVNQLAHQHLVTALLPLIQAAEAGRVIITASEVHNPASGGGRVGQPAGLGTLDGLKRGPGFEMVDGRSDFDADKAYKDSKLCNLLLARQLVSRLAHERSTLPVITWSPGLVIPRSADGFFRDSRRVNPLGQAIFALIARDLLRLTVSVEQAGSLLVDLISADQFAPGFHYLSNVLKGPGRHQFEATATSDEAANLKLASELYATCSSLITHACSKPSGTA
ncbi:SDR family NAD(P)-dependent oxidoreductase [Parasynechococcus sp.]|uniref:SDR family NAD(P)-dependent oxidoreductase n=1 Tax=Parasynechococcus sp. TaxID=3101203 RepID=UPI00370427D2